MGLEIPLSEELTAELFEFWVEVFGNQPDLTKGVLLGEEQEHNRDTLYLTKLSDKMAGTCVVTTSNRVPILGGFGEVATAPEFRRHGIATGLCEQAVKGFRAGGGEAIFLGTGNPEAARVYHRLGWRKLAGAQVMANITSGDSPEAFLVDYFRGQGETSVRPATPEARIPMIPLLHTPHDWQVLDANAGMCSTRYRVQGSCMGLYPRYETVTREGRGAWFGAYTDEGRLVGMSTARLDDSGSCQVDGFAHRRFMGGWEDLMQAAIGWGSDSGASAVFATLSVEDEDKQSLLEGLGFRRGGRAGRFDLDGRAVESLRMDM